MTVYGGSDINHMGVFLSRRRLRRQNEVELSGFARLRPGIGDRRFDLSIDNQSDLVSGHSQAIADVAAIGINFNDLGKFFASIRTSAPLIGRLLGSFTSPSRTDVPAAQTLNVTSSEPTKPRMNDLESIVGVLARFF
jgi:hypothetical protein